MYRHVKVANELVTTRSDIRKGFLRYAEEKRHRADPHLLAARNLRERASSVAEASDLLEMYEIREELLTASGLSDKSLKHMEEADKDAAIAWLVNTVLQPAGEEFVNELVYRFLLTRGDSLGGTMRNKVGRLGEQTLVRHILSVICSVDLGYMWYPSTGSPMGVRKWLEGTEDFEVVTAGVTALWWKTVDGSRTLVFNRKIPVVGNNIDICVFEGPGEAPQGTRINVPLDDPLILGELKGGIDPAGADEHWKTADSALKRIRNRLPDVDSLFVGSAIEKAMAVEIFDYLQDGTLTCAGNLMNDEQMRGVAKWLVG